MALLTLGERTYHLLVNRHFSIHSHRSSAAHSSHVRSFIPTLPARQTLGSGHYLLSSPIKPGFLRLPYLSPSSANGIKLVGSWNYVSGMPFLQDTRPLTLFTRIKCGRSPRDLSVFSTYDCWNSELLASLWNHMFFPWRLMSSVPSRPGSHSNKQCYTGFLAGTV